MKPHSIRRGLWLANLALGAAVLGAGAWYLTQVRPAVASITNRKANFRPPEYEKLRKEYEGSRVTGLKWKPKAPVSDAEIHAVVLRADYKRKKPTHWIFSGPLPPAEVKDDGPVDVGPPPPTGLDSLGKVLTVIVNPPNSTILFKFTAGKSRAFGVGDFVQMSKEDPRRFKITKISEPRPRVFQIDYDVFGKDASKAERSDALSYNRSGSDVPDPPFLRRVGPAGDGVPAQPAAGAPAGATTAAGTAQPGDGTGQPGAGAPPPGTGDTPAGTEVVRVNSKRDEDLTVADLKPVKVLYNKDNRNERGIRFDDTTYRYLKSKNARSVAETVKTSVAKDPSGRVIGLRITGFADNAPADAFDVKQGDILVSINGQKVSSRAEAVRIAQSLDATKLVRVVIDRRGRLITYNVDPQDPRNIRRVRYFENFVE